MTATAENIAADEIQVAEYKPTVAALSTLRERFGSVVYDVATTKGMKDAKDARKEVRDYRTSLENKRKEIKAPALQRCRDIDEEAKSITSQLRDIEDPIDEQIKAEEQRKQREKEEAERKERERVEAIRHAIDVIRTTPSTLIGADVTELTDAADDIRATPIGEDRFAEFTQDALAAKQQALQQLATMIDSAKAQEELAEMKRQQAEQAAQQAVASEPAAAEEGHPASAEPDASPIDASRIADAGMRGEKQLAAQRAEPADASPAPSIINELRNDLIGAAGLYASQAEDVIQAIKAGRVRHLIITE